MRFDEIWSGPDQLAETAKLAKSTSHMPGAVVEIGVWQGLTTIAIANAVYPDQVHVVDHWEGSEDIPTEMSARDNFGIFRENMAEATKGNYCPHKEDWRFFVKWWDEPIRFLHLDAGHGADEVSECLDALEPFSRPGSIFAGDDWNWPSVQEGVLQVFHVNTVSIFANKLWWVTIK